MKLLDKGKKGYFLEKSINWIKKLCIRNGVHIRKKKGTSKRRNQNTFKVREIEEGSFGYNNILGLQT